MGFLKVGKANQAFCACGIVKNALKYCLVVLGVTHTRFKLPSTLYQALGMIAALLASPSVQVIGESLMHFELLSSLVRSAKLTGAMIHDARIAAICLSHGVRELLSADRDFSRFPQLKVRNPLIGT